MRRSLVDTATLPSAAPMAAGRGPDDRRTAPSPARRRPGGASGRIPPSLALAIARQESEMNPEAVSHAGARGLMQLMPGTAKLVAGRLGMPYDLGRLTADWRYNARLGTDYLGGLIEEFGSWPLAAAGYNLRWLMRWLLAFRVRILACVMSRSDGQDGETLLFPA